MKVLVNCGFIYPKNKMNKPKLIRSLRNQKFPNHIVKVFENVERERFVPEKFKEQSYEDIPLPIGQGQTISQPYTIAFMLMMLEIPKESENNKDLSVLEIGSGSGYVLALLKELIPQGKIYGIERIKEIAEKSQKILEENKNIQIIHGNGSKGLPEKSPFDRILVSARCKTIPQKLVNQLRYNSVLVAPVGNSLVVVKKKSGENEITKYPGFSFVPLVEEE